MPHEPNSGEGATSNWHAQRAVGRETPTYLDHLMCLSVLLQSNVAGSVFLHHRLVIMFRYQADPEGLIREDDLQCATYLETHLEVLVAQVLLVTAPELEPRNELGNLHDSGRYLHELEYADAGGERRRARKVR